MFPLEKHGRSIPAGRLAWGEAMFRYVSVFGLGYLIEVFDRVSGFLSSLLVGSGMRGSLPALAASWPLHRA